MQTDASKGQAERPTNLRDYTVELVKQRPRDVTLRDIANGSGVSLAWLQLFAKGSITEPGVNRVEAIYTYLVGGPLDLH